MINNLERAGQLMTLPKLQPGLHGACPDWNLAANGCRYYIQAGNNNALLFFPCYPGAFCLSAWLKGGRVRKAWFTWRAQVVEQSRVAIG